MPAGSPASSSTCWRAACNRPSGRCSSGSSTESRRAALLPVEVDKHAELFDTAFAFYGAVQFRVVQLAWPDRNGWMPWEDGFEHRLLLAEPVVGSLDEVD